MKPRAGRWLALAVAASVAGLDRVSKNAVERWAGEHPLAPSVELIGDAVRITYVQNRGIVFGLLGDGALARSPWLPALLSVVVVSVLLRYLLVAEPERPRVWLGLACLVGGGLGNLYDRIRFGYVPDFIDVSLYFTRWYVFNLADAAIVCGVGLLALDLLRPGEANAERAR